MTGHKKRPVPASTSLWNQLTHYSKRPANYPQLSSGIKCQLDHNQRPAHHTRQGFETLNAAAMTVIHGSFVPARYSNIVGCVGKYNTPRGNSQRRSFAVRSTRHLFGVNSKTNGDHIMAQSQQDESVHTPEIQKITSLGDHGEIERIEYRVIIGDQYWITDSLDDAREIAAAEGGAA